MIVWLILAAVVAYAVYSGVIRAPMRHEALAGGLALVAALLASRGSAILALGTGALAVAAYLAGETAMRRTLAHEADALSALGLAPGATAEQVRAAHRRLSGVAHPDHGGSHVEQQKLNAARDLLLRRIADGMR